MRPSRAIASDPHCPPRGAVTAVRHRPGRRASSGGCLAVVVLVAVLAARTGVTPTTSTSPTPALTSAASAATTPLAIAVFQATPTPAPATTLAAAPPATVALPDHLLTPGEVFAGVTAVQVCTYGWASSHRSVAVAQYHEVYGEYGIPYPEPSGTYELDHLIPLELGGDNSNVNLWPEPAAPTPGFHQKDELENALHDRVCAGSLPLSSAQHDIATNWYAAYLEYVAG